MSNAILTERDARRVKGALWLGERQSDIAIKYGVTQTTVSRIARGEAWPQVKWPDGSQGAMPLAQRQKIHTMRLGRTTPTEKGAEE